MKWKQAVTPDSDNPVPRGEAWDGSGTALRRLQTRSQGEATSLITKSRKRDS